MRSAWRQASIVQNRVQRAGLVALWLVRKVEEALTDAVYRRRGLDTSGPDIAYQLGEDQLGYVATDWRVLRKLFPKGSMGSGDILLDYGAGKGRVVIWAAHRFPLVRVIGVDHDEDMIRLARLNLARWRGGLRCRDVELVQADARAYEVPDDTTVIFMYNPFMGRVFCDVVERIGESLERYPRSVRIVYFYPIMHDALVSAGFEVEQFQRHLFWAWGMYRKSLPSLPGSGFPDTSTVPGSSGH